MQDHVGKTGTPSDNPMTETEDGVVYTNVIRVKADPPDVSSDERKKRVKALAGAIAHSMRRFGEVHVRSIGKEALYKGVKAIIDASGMVAVHGYDLYTRPGYIMATDVADKDDMTGISFLVVSSASGKDQKE
jgi:stage V sporulation protein SpoVS